MANRPFMLLWSAQAISQTAQNAIWFALMVLIEEATRSTAQVGIAIIAYVLPSVLFTVPAGVMIDRMDKRWVLVATNWLRALVVLGYLFFQHSLILLYTVTFVFSVISQFFLPAEAAMIPALVGKNKLITANSLFNLTFTLSQLVGIVFMAPIMIKLFGINPLFIIISLLFVLCGFMVFSLPSHNSAKLAGSSGGNGERAFRQFFRDLRETWDFVVSNRLAALALAMLTVGATISLITAMIAPRYMVAVVGIRADDTVYVLAPAGFGMALGAVLIGRLSRWVPKELLVVVGMAVVSLGMLLLAVVGPVWNLMFQVLAMIVDPANLPRAVSLVSVVMLVAAVMGLALSLVIIASQTALQELAPVASRGRIFAVQIMLGNLASILPLVLVGSLADWIGVAQTLGLLALTMVGLSYLAFRGYRERIWGPRLG